MGFASTRCSTALPGRSPHFFVSGEEGGDAIIPSPTGMAGRGDPPWLTVNGEVEDGGGEAVVEVGVGDLVLVVVGAQQAVVAPHLVVDGGHPAAGVGDPQRVDVLLLRPVGDVLPDGAVPAPVVLLPQELGGRGVRGGLWVGTPHHPSSSLLPTQRLRRSPLLPVRVQHLAPARAGLWGWIQHPRGLSTQPRGKDSGCSRTDPRGTPHHAPIAGALAAHPPSKRLWVFPGSFQALALRTRVRLGVWLGDSSLSPLLTCCTPPAPSAARGWGRRELSRRAATCPSRPETPAFVWAATCPNTAAGIGKGAGSPAPIRAGK